MTSFHAALGAALCAAILAVAAVKLQHAASDDTIRVVTGMASKVARYPDAPVLAVPTDTAQTLPAPTSSIASPTPDDDALNLDQTDEPFTAQTRDPVWAGQVESDIVNRLPSGGRIDCAQFVCKISIPVTGQTSSSRSGSAFDAQAANRIDEPDQSATFATRNWPPELSYNAKTARIIDGPEGRSLTFFATRTQWPATD